MRDLGILGSKRDGLIKSFPSQTPRIEGALKKKRQKGCKRQKGSRTPKKNVQCPLDTAALTDWQDAQGLHRSATDGVSALKGKVGTSPFPSPETIVN